MKTKTHKLDKVRLALIGCWQDNAEKWGHRVGDYIDTEMLTDVAIEAYDTHQTAQNTALELSVEYLTEENTRYKEALEWIELQAIDKGDWVWIPKVEFEQAIDRAFNPPENVTQSDKEVSND